MMSTPLCHIKSVTTVYASEVQPLSDDIRWIFQKRSDGWYRRLYNFTNGTWIGEWEKVS